MISGKEPNEKNRNGKIQIMRITLEERQPDGELGFLEPCRKFYQPGWDLSTCTLMAVVEVACTSITEQN